MKKRLVVLSINVLIIILATILSERFDDYSFLIGYFTGAFTYGMVSWSNPIIKEENKNA